MKKFAMVLGMSVLGLMVGGASGAVFSMGGHSYTTEFNAGSGSNSSMMVLEYVPDQVFLFGYNWNTPTDVSVPDPTGEDMLFALRDASGGALTVDFQSFSFGDFIRSMSYGTHQVVYDEDTSWFGYFLSGDGKTWDSAETGAGGRDLVDGAWDDWVYQTTPAVEPFFVVPTLPSFGSAAPEPASVGVLVVATLMLARRRMR